MVDKNLKKKADKLSKKYPNFYSLSQNFWDTKYKRMTKGKFGMFTNKGNKAVRRIAKNSKTFDEAVIKLKKLSEIHGEAMDTDVRVNVLYFIEKNKTLN